MGPNDAPTVVLDAEGRLSASSDLERTTPERLAGQVCAAVGDLLGPRATVVRCSVMGQQWHPFAMVMLRDETSGGFLSGTASANTGVDALVQAVLTALGADDDVLRAIAGRWRTAPDVDAVVVTDGSDTSPTQPGEDRAAALVRLAWTLPAPGRLAVVTGDAEYRVLRLPAVALGIATRPAASVLEDVDTWMAKAEALGP